MPTPARSLSIDDVRRFLRDSCAGPASERRVGLEVEWLTVCAGNPRAHVDFEQVEDIATAAERPAGSRLTFEPGGQVELSSAPLASVSAAIESIHLDGAELARSLAKADVTLLGVGMDDRPIRRVRRLPRYQAMESFFDLGGFAGRRMMNATAAIQVNVDGGGDALDARWRQAHAVGPVLAAMFANSPLVGGAPSGWRSARMANWWAIDATRTAPVDGANAVEAWIRCALAANVMLIRTSEDEFTPMPELMPFARWVEEGHELGWPTLDDVAYHLTTLFPPVRLRGWIEMRALDALPMEWWPVASAVSVALLDDDEAADAAARACAEAAGRWLPAFRHGPSDPAIGRAARACFSAALEAFPRLGVDATTARDAERFYERYVERGRCPADDILDRARHGAGDLLSEAT